MESKLEKLRAELGGYMDAQDWDVDLEEEDRRQLAVLKVCDGRVTGGSF
jgi:hypothetical protein